MATISDGSPEGAFPARFCLKSRVAVAIGGRLSEHEADVVATRQDGESVRETGGEMEACRSRTICHNVARTSMYRFGRPEEMVCAAVLMASGENS